ncbi:MAG: phosphoadenosine phosphosulfate reductase family protein [Planctomycetes bacterium]|nr:phosphoadenosine phosphosulfate reductase family protein [Planctomycetota bacterium]
MKAERHPENSSAHSPYELGWREAAKQLAARRLSGLRVRCPACDAQGLLISKWEPAVAVKPLYVVHGNGNGRLRACRMSKVHAASVRREACLTSGDVSKTLRMGRPFVLLSGGTDSVCTLLYMRKLAERAGVEITALHADTTAGFPEVEDYVRRLCRDLRVPLVTVRPERDFFETAKKWGIPGVRSRWCCKTLKVSPIRRYLAQLDGPKIIYDGIRAVESPTRATYVPVWFHPAFRCLSISPIFYWPDSKVSDYVRHSRVPRSPTAEMGCSGECWCGAYKSRADFEALLRVHPDIFGKLVQVEKAQRGKYTFLYEQGKRIPLTALRRNGRGIRAAIQ